MERALTLIGLRALVSDNEIWHARPQVYALQPKTFIEDRGSNQIEDGDYFQFVKAARAFSASDSRDHIFALAGLATEEERSQYALNYDQSSHEVFTAFAVTLIKRSKSLDILGEAGAADGSGLPSWTPDWSHPPKVHSLVQGSSSTYKAADCQQADASWSEDSTTLYISAKVIDKLAGLEPGFTPTAESNESDDATEADSDGVLRVRDMFRSSNRPWLAKSTTSREQADMFEDSMLQLSDTLRFLTTVSKISQSNSKRSNRVEAQALLLDGAWYSMCSSASRLKDWYYRNEKTRRIKPELEATWANAARRCTKYDGEEGFLDAYAATLTGNASFSGLGGADFSQKWRRDLYLIWRERIHRHPFFGRSNDSKREFAELPQELKSLFYQQVPGGHSGNLPASEIGRDTHTQFNTKHGPPIFVSNDVLRGLDKVQKLGSSVVQGAANLIQKASASKHRNTDKRSNTDDDTGTVEGEPNESSKNGEGVGPPARRPTAPAFRAQDDTMAKQALSRMYGREVERISTQRLFCRTKGGDMGWVPPDAKVGDAVAILKGGKVPFVLRCEKTGGLDGEGTWKLVGEAFVRGLMNGEAARDDGKPWVRMGIR